MSQGDAFECVIPSPGGNNSSLRTAGCFGDCRHGEMRIRWDVKMERKRVARCRSAGFGARKLKERAKDRGVELKTLGGVTDGSKRQ